MDPSRLKNIIFIFILNLILLSGEMAFPSDSKISFLPSIRATSSVKYSKFWAQEQIGSDLVHKRMANLNFSPHSEEDICVVIDDFDNTSKGYHGFLVRSLIIDTGKHSVLPALSFNQNNGLRPTCRSINLIPSSRDISPEPAPYDSFGSGISAAPSQFKSVDLLQEEVEGLFQRNPRGIIINYSIKITDSSPLYTFEEFLFEHLVEDSTSRFIVVIASGNSYQSNPSILGSIQEIYDQDRAIIVGSSSPTGSVSDFSQGGGITILAPSDRHILAAHGRETTFSGTSGAAPLVTGVLTGFNLISGYKLSVQEAISLLTKTAIPLLSSLDPENKNGPGLLNAFKIIEIAFRLKELCIEKIDHEKAACFHKGIMGTSDQDIYEFKSEISLASSLNQIQLSCDGPEQSSGCVEIKRQALEDLRKAAFLNQNDFLLWESLADIYERENILDNAAFYRSVASAIKMMQIMQEDESQLRESWADIYENENILENEDESHNVAASPGSKGSIRQELVF